MIARFSPSVVWWYGIWNNHESSGANSASRDANQSEIGPSGPAQTSLSGRERSDLNREMLFAPLERKCARIKCAIRIHVVWQYATKQ